MIKDLMLLFRKKERVVIGLISGTSMDGIDAALVKIKGKGAGAEIELLEFTCIPYSPEIIARLGQLQHGCTPGEISELNFLVGEAFAGAAQSVMEKAGLAPNDVDLIGSHGQTVSHVPPSAGAGIPSTLQIGEPDVIAERTGITTVGDFRTRDVAAGGEGAPLVPYADYILFSKPGETKIAQNLGGIANATVITESIDGVTAFDTGPGNMLMDRIMALSSGGSERFDRDGKEASKGKVNETLLKELLSDPYYIKEPPKSTGEELFGNAAAERLYGMVTGGKITLSDLMATVLALTVESISQSYEKFILPEHEVSEVILSGGGCRNAILVKKLRERLGGIKLTTTDAYGIPADAKEAVAFAILANECISGNAGNLPGVTGARRGVPLGKISPGGLG
ncbi:MAG: anhydro-N-acetylmuramic acid kinase [Thermodesulfobacteriota bacterium]